MLDGRIHCLVCDKMFSSVTSSRNHLRNTHNPQAVQCSLCSIISASVHSFRMHVKRSHGITGARNVLETYGRLLE